MFNVICNIIGVLLLIVGMVEVISICVLLLLRKRGENNVMIIVPIKGHNEEAEFLLRSAVASVNWKTVNTKQPIICLDCGMDEETRKVCEILSKDYEFIDIQEISEIKNKFENIKD